MIDAHDLSMDQKSKNRVADFSFLITVDGKVAILLIISTRRYKMWAMLEIAPILYYM